MGVTVQPPTPRKLSEAQLTFSAHTKKKFCVLARSPQHKDSKGQPIKSLIFLSIN